MDISLLEVLSRFAPNTIKSETLELFSDQLTGVTINHESLLKELDKKINNDHSIAFVKFIFNKLYNSGVEYQTNCIYCQEKSIYLGDLYLGTKQDAEDLEYYGMPPLFVYGNLILENCSKIHRDLVIFGNLTILSKVERCFNVFARNNLIIGAEIVDADMIECDEIQKLNKSESIPICSSTLVINKETEYSHYSCSG